MEEPGLFLCLFLFRWRDGGLDDVLGGVVELTSGDVRGMMASNLGRCSNGVLEVENDPSTLGDRKSSPFIVSRARKLENTTRDKVQALALQARLKSMQGCSRCEKSNGEDDSGVFELPSLAWTRSNRIHP
jgi:hypothetical protein